MSAHVPPGTVEADARPQPLAAPILLAVFVGGVLGTLARVGLGELFGLAADPALREFGDAAGYLTDPALQATLVANLVGSLALGVVTGAHVPTRLAWLRAGLGAGFCGAFTTFSYVVLALAALDLRTPWGWALLVGGVLGGLLLARVGLVIGGAIAPDPAAPRAPSEVDR